MNFQHKIKPIATLCIGITTLLLLVTGCSGSSSSSSSNGSVSGVATPSKVSVVNTK